MSDRRDRTLRQLAEDLAAAGADVLEVRRAVQLERDRAIRGYDLTAGEADALEHLGDEWEAARTQWHKRGPELAAAIYALDEDERAILALTKPPPPPTPPHKSGRKQRPTPGHIGTIAPPSSIDEMLDAADFERAERARVEALAARLAGAGPAAHRPAHPTPKSMQRRGRALRKHQHSPAPYQAAMYLGGSIKDLDGWIRRGVTSPDATERAICRRVKPAPLMERAIAFVLFHLAVRVEGGRLGYVGAVTGYSRELVAGLLPARNARGEQVSADCISRHLRGLRRRLAGLFTAHQPAPPSVAEGKLPGARHLMEDGSITHQAYNLYRFYEAPSPAQQTGAPPEVLSLSAPVDPRSLYLAKQTLQQFRRDLESSDREAAARPPPDRGKTGF